ncbi:FAD-dependent monooxygenase [Streptomyces sp. NPDC021020]|uniref:FAD-dependent monooxygenase n=1 Tax=Streptomyces sp. NPDC021020 TaxID=3365109 RepID=UPI003793F4A9
MTTTADIVIAGAGIGGLTAALALHARGRRPLVLEAAEAIRPLGVGINIQPAAVAELTALGLGDALAATGIPTREHRYLDTTGATVMTEARGKDAGHAHPQFSIHRGELQMLLLTAVLDRLGPDAVHTGSRLVGFEPSADGAGVRVHAERTAVGSTARTQYAAKALIGADGLHSAVRARLHPDRMELLPAGVHMWRGLAELPEFLDGRTMILANDDRGARMIAYPCSARHARRGAVLLNWVCMVPTAVDGPPAGWDARAPLEDVLPHFADWDLGWLDVPGVLRRSPRILQYPMVDRDPLPHWGEGSVTLLGDAAHLMYPIGANGASQAILDAAALAAELGGDDGLRDVPAALLRYEATRRPATSAVILANRTMDSAERALSALPAGQDRAGTLRAVTGTYRATVEKSPGRPG